jgi:hypothetical protein
MRVKEKSESSPDTFGVKGDRRSRDNCFVNKSTTLRPVAMSAGRQRWQPSGSGLANSGGGGSNVATKRASKPSSRAALGALGRPIGRSLSFLQPTAKLYRLARVCGPVIAPLRPIRSRKAGRPVLFWVGSGKLMLIDDRARDSFATRLRQPPLVVVSRLRSCLSCRRFPTLPSDRNVRP